MEPYIDVLFKLIFARVVQNKTPRFCKLFIHSYCVFAIIHGPNTLFDYLEKVQIGIVANLITQLWLPNAPHFAAADSLEVNQLLVGGVRLLCETGVTRDVNSFCSLLKALIVLLQQSNTVDTATEALLESLLEDEVAENREFDSKFSRLAFSQIPEPSPTEQVLKSHSFFAVTLSTLCRNNPGIYLNAMKASLSKLEIDTLQEVMQAAGQSLI
jgi:hypothetical protein